MRLPPSSAIILLNFTLAACVTPPPTFSVSMPGLTVNVGGDLDVWAINMAQWAFADSERLAGRPVEAARASAAVEYLAVELNTPRWIGISPITQMQMVSARVELRQTLGIAPDAASQPVISSLLDCANALAAGDAAAAATTLRTPYFTFGAERTLEILNAMPFMSTVNIATMHAGMASPNGLSGWRR